MAAANSTTFFQNVCQLVSTSASPKQPQSLIGLAIASHSVSSVITTMRISTISDTRRRRMAKSRQMPRKNSADDCTTETASVTKSGTTEARPQAVR